METGCQTGSLEAAPGPALAHIDLRASQHMHACAIEHAAGARAFSIQRFHWRLHRQANVLELHMPTGTSALSRTSASTWIMYYVGDLESFSCEISLPLMKPLYAESSTWNDWNSDRAQIVQEVSPPSFENSICRDLIVIS